MVSISHFTQQNIRPIAHFKYQSIQKMYLVSRRHGDIARNIVTLLRFSFQVLNFEYHSDISTFVLDTSRSQLWYEFYSRVWTS